MQLNSGENCYLVKPAPARYLCATLQHRSIPNDQHDPDPFRSHRS
jgi:hypothetical protein